MNAIWLAFIVAGCVSSIVTGRVDALISSLLDATYDAVKLSLNLCGGFCLWLGIQKLAEESGLVDTLALLARPLAKRIFAGLEAGGKAAGLISVAILSNLLGLSSATPLGLRAMVSIKEELGETTRAVECMDKLVIISAAGCCLFPSTIIAVRAAMGSSNPAIIAGPTLFAGFCSAAGGLLAYGLLRHLA